MNCWPGNGINGCNRTDFRMIWTSAHVPIKHHNTSALICHDISKSTSKLTAYIATAWVKGDIVVVQGGVHKHKHDIVAAVGGLLEKSKGRARIIWVDTPAPNFNTKNGWYSPEMHGGSDKCTARQKKAHQPYPPPKMLARLLGVVSLAGYGDGGLATTKVGSLGPFGNNGTDCLHSCLLGPPDAVASALATLMLAAL